MSDRIEGAHLDVVGVLVVVGRVEDDLLRGLRRDVAGRHGAHAAAASAVGPLLAGRSLLAHGVFWLAERHLLAMETSDSLTLRIGRAGMSVGGKFA